MNYAASESPEGITGQRKETRIPVATEPAEPAYTRPVAPEPRPYIPPPPANLNDEHAAEWDTLIAQTSAALRAEGMSQASIEAVVASLRARQAGQTTAERQIQAEHQEDQEYQEDQQTQESESSEPSERQTKRRGQHGQLTSK